jgi:hypothetical protein
MATAPVSIAPVLTPHTLGVLADNLERDHFAEKALFLRKLQPFVHDVVEKFFVPLSTRATKGTIVSRFNRLSTNFEPFRLYLNVRLLSIIENQEFFGFYERMLCDVLEPLMKTAREMDLSPELISAAVRDFMRILRAVGQSAGSAPPQDGDMSVEQFTNFVNWIHAATRFDYGLTAVFLVLERSVPEPVSTDKSTLLSIFKKSVLEYGRAASKVVVHEQMHCALRDLETPHINITVTRKRVLVSSMPQHDQKIIGKHGRQRPKEVSSDPSYSLFPSRKAGDSWEYESPR